MNMRRYQWYSDRSAEAQGQSGHQQECSTDDLKGETWDRELIENLRSIVQQHCSAARLEHLRSEWSLHSEATQLAYQFAQSFAHMSPTKQVVIFRFFLYGVHDEQSTQLRIEQSFLRRLTGLDSTELQYHLSSLSTLGYEYILHEPDEHLRSRGQGAYLILRWHALVEEGWVNATPLAVLTMRSLIADRSEEAALTLLQRAGKPAPAVIRDPAPHQMSCSGRTRVKDGEQ